MSNIGSERGGVITPQPMLDGVLALKPLQDNDLETELAFLTIINGEKIGPYLPAINTVTDKLKNFEWRYSAAFGFGEGVLIAMNQDLAPCPSKLKNKVSAWAQKSNNDPESMLESLKRRSSCLRGYSEVLDAYSEARKKHKDQTVAATLGLAHLIRLAVSIG